MSLRGSDERLAELKRTDNWTNWRWILWEYGCLVAVIGGSVTVAEWVAAAGLEWWWNVPVFAVAILLIGAIQHRLAGLGHEASHEILFRNRLMNDLVGDLLCLFPLFASVHTYRLFHAAHHRFTNDPERDPDLVVLGRSKQVERFPMDRRRFVVTQLLRWLTNPWSMVRYQMDYFYINTLGKGGNPLLRGLEGSDVDDPRPRLGTVLGILGVVGYGVVLGVMNRVGLGEWLLAALGVGLVVAGVGMAWVPERWLFRSPFEQAYGPRVGGFLRVAYYLVVLTGMASARGVTGGRVVWYGLWLWLVPLGTSFAYCMLLRDLFQHTNADAGRLTNSRVFRPGRLLRWAVFVYGQDIHLTHHLYPGVPHYRLRELHEWLRQEDPRYAAAVVECGGLFRGDGRRPAIVDVLGPRWAGPAAGAIAAARRGRPEVGSGLRSQTEVDRRALS
ncbi:MAG: hypothetical protein KatS3mg108_3621 [Isosphaeraceae bacterium]|nr:MAG: hypothetical protein KatS3mg108_3621 [Isosphaeraceae bacterium]